MKTFRVHSGLAAPLPQANIDTDQIIPKQFLKRIERTGFGAFLFYDWRFRPDGTPNPDFVLNQPRYQGASILLAAKNFGCGSSREHAPWALDDYGFRAIVAPSFADIFANNCTKNGMVPVILPESDVDELLRRAQDNENYCPTIDLEEGLVTDAQGFRAEFQIDSFKRYCLLNGLDDIGLTMRHEAALDEYETRSPAWRNAAAYSSFQ